MNIKELTDETLQAVIDDACNDTHITGSCTNIDIRSTCLAWEREAPARLALARALLSRLPEPTPPVVDGKTPGQVAFEVTASEWRTWSITHPSVKVQWEKTASAVLAAFGHSGLDAAIARMEAVPWNELPGEVLTAESIRARLIKAARDGQSAPKADIYHDNPRYRIKPWTLPPPPEGQEWHRTDWTEDMLPEGWRPLLNDEAYLAGDEYFSEQTMDWRVETYSGCRPVRQGSTHARTRRPLPAPTVTVHLDASDIRATDEFRYEDGAVIQTAEYWDNEAVELTYSGPTDYARLASFLRRQHGSDEWKPCTKEISANKH